MANTHDNLTELFSGIADAIRSKTGSTAKIKADNFPSAISNIEAGGGGPSAVLGTKNINANGTYNASSDGLDGFSTVNVNVPASGIDTSDANATENDILKGATAYVKGQMITGKHECPSAPEVKLQTKRVTPTTSFQPVDYDAADGYTGLARVEIEAIQTQSKEIYRNGTYTPDTGKFFDSVTVNILTDAKLGEATSYTFGQIGITQTTTTTSYTCAESTHVEDGKIILDNPVSKTFTMKSSDTSGACFDAIKGMYFQNSGTTYYVPPDCSIVRSAVKGSGNATTGYAYKGSIYPVIVDAGTVMGTKTITENGTYYASDDGFDGFESVNVNVELELPPIEVSSRGTASDLASGKQLYDEHGNLVTGTHECDEGVTLPTLNNPGSAADLASGKQFYDENGNLVTGNVREIAGDDFYVDDECGVSGKMLSEYTVSATWPTDGDTLFRKGVPVEFRFPVSQLGISGGSAGYSVKTGTTTSTTINTGLSSIEYFFMYRNAAVSSQGLISLHYYAKDSIATTSAMRASQWATTTYGAKSITHDNSAATVSGGTITIPSALASGVTYMWTAVGK